MHIKIDASSGFNNLYHKKTNISILIRILINLIKRFNFLSVSILTLDA